MCIMGVAGMTPQAVKSTVLQTLFHAIAVDFTHPYRLAFNFAAEVV
jgi:hypothetical protein